MKPRNQFERAVDEVRHLLKPLDKKDLDKIETMFSEMDCEAIDRIQDERSWNHSYNECSYKNSIAMQSYYTKIETFKGMQVVRTFSLELRKRGINSFPKTRYKEVLQKWYADGGKSAVVACQFRSFSYGTEDWAFGTKLEFRTPHVNTNSYNSRTMYLQVAERENIRLVTIAPFMKKYGISSSIPQFQRMNKAVALDVAQTFVGEYLLKSKSYDTFAKLTNGYISFSRLEKYLPSLKICIRHGYKIKDFSLWLDMLEFLEKLGKDLHSPKYIMPDDLKRQHDVWFNKLHEKERMERIKKEMEDARQHEADYHAAKKNYFGLSFATKSGLICRSVESVAEMIDEGKNMHHCVGNYWRHNDSLIMVCRSSNDDRIATIEVNLQKLSVVQIRGLQNSKPQQFDEILEALNKFMYKIKERRDNPADFDPDAVELLQAAS